MGEVLIRALDFLRARRLRKFLLAAITIAALFVGVTAMHSMSGETDGHSAATAAVINHAGHGVVSGESMSHAAAVQAVTNAEGLFCDDMCGMNCLLVGMVCAMSVLVALLGVLLFRRPAWPLERAVEIVRILRISAERIALPSAPSLTLLSISRT